MSRPIAVGAPLLAVLIIACGKKPVPIADVQDPGGPPVATNEARLRTQPADPDPCSWVSAAEATRLLGPLAGAPWRANHSDEAEPDPKGFACGYTLASGGEHKIVVELITDGANGIEDAFAMMKDKLTHGGTKGAFKEAWQAAVGDKPVLGWDAVSTLPDMFVGRLGAIAVRVGIHGGHVPADSIEHLAALVRDRLPDLPFATPRRYYDSGDGPDPCALVTPNEAEAILGKLAMPPYRSNGKKTSFADPGGNGCSYFLGHHRVFTIDGTWEQGKAIFRMTAGLNANINAAVGTVGDVADTLEGSWDQAGAGPGGSLCFLKGDQMLEVVYQTAAVDRNAAVRLAALAVGRLRE